MLEEVLYIVLVEVQKEQEVHHLAVVGKVVQVDQCHLLVVDQEVGVEGEAGNIFFDFKYYSLVYNDLKHGLQ